MSTYLGHVFDPSEWRKGVIPNSQTKIAAVPIIGLRVDPSNKLSVWDMGDGTDSDVIFRQSLAALATTHNNVRTLEFALMSSNYADANSMRLLKTTGMTRAERHINLLHRDIAEIDLHVLSLLAFWFHTSAHRKDEDSMGDHFRKVRIKGKRTREILKEALQEKWILKTSLSPEFLSDIYAGP